MQHTFIVRVPEADAWTLAQADSPAHAAAIVAASNSGGRFDDMDWTAEHSSRCECGTGQLRHGGTLAGAKA